MLIYFSLSRLKWDGLLSIVRLSFSILNDNKLYSTTPRWGEISLSSRWYLIINYPALGKVQLLSVLDDI